MRKKIFLLSFGIGIVAIIFFLSVLNKFLFEVDNDNFFDALDKAVYFSDQQNELISQNELEKEDILLVTTSADLIDVVARSNIQIIYLHPDILQKVDSVWLREQYNEGIVIVAFNTPISILGEKVGIRAILVDDIDLDKSYGRLGVSAVQTKGEINNRHSDGQFSEFYADFSIVSMLVESNFLNDENP